MRIRSTFFRSARSSFPLGFRGLVIQGSRSSTFPDGVTSLNAACPYQVSWVFAAPATWGGTEDEAVWAAATSEVEQSRTAKTRARGRFKVRFLPCRWTPRAPHSRPGPAEARTAWHHRGEADFCPSRRARARPALPSLRPPRARCGPAPRDDE